MVVVDRDRAALDSMVATHGDAVTPSSSTCSTRQTARALLPKVLISPGQLDIFHSNAGMYVGGDLVEASAGEIDHMLNLNVNVS